MINICIYTQINSEKEEISIMLHELAAKCSNELWNIKCFLDRSELERYIKNNPVVNVFIFDVTKEENVKLLLNIRKKYDLSYLMIIADCGQSPMSYIKPGINAQTLLLRPFGAAKLYDVLKDFISEYIRKFNAAEEANDDVFVVSTKDGKTIIPYEQIYYFEALRKKVYVCTGMDEYGFYGTLEDTCEMLPNDFLRCHRSYIVNANKIEKIALSKSLIYMAKGIEIPLSRRYKPVMKTRCMA